MTLDELKERYETTGRMPVIYVAGPMSGIDEYNFPAFNKQAHRLRLLGFPVLNPADFGEGVAELDHAPEETAWLLAMQRDLPLVAACDAIVLLQGWENSRGANLEYNTAVALGKLVVEVEEDDLLEFVLAFMTAEELEEVHQADNLAEDARQLYLDGDEGIILVYGKDVAEGRGPCGVPGCECSEQGEAS